MVRRDRKLGFAEFGPLRGRPVIWLHGTPGARRQIPEAARVAAFELDVRLIGIDRPGVGLSTPHLYDSILDFTTDLEIVLDQLGLERVAMVGLSGGGPYALAAARALLKETKLTAPEIVRKGLEIAGEICIYTNANITVIEPAS